MEGMGLKLTPVVVRHLLGPLGLFRPTALWLVLLGLIAIPNSPSRGISHLQLLALPHPSHPPTPYNVPSVIYYSHCEKVTQNPAVLAS